MDLKNRRWLLLIVMPAIISIILMHYFSIFETSIFRTLGNDSITYRTPWERPRYFIMIPRFILLIYSMLLVLVIIPTSYYLISRKLEERLERNMRVISKLIQKSGSLSKTKLMEKDTKYIVLRFLNMNERKVLEKLMEEKGSILQSEINLVEGMTKLKTHRAVRDLERKGIIITETYGKTNRVILSKDIEEFMIK